MNEGLKGYLRAGEPSLAIFRLGGQGFAMPYDAVLSVVSSQANTHHTQAGIRLKGHIAHNGEEVVLLKPEQFLSHPAEETAIQAYVVAQQDNYKVALPFNGYCKVISQGNGSQQISELAELEFEKISITRLCQQAGIKPTASSARLNIESNIAKATARHTSEQHFLIAQAGKYTLAIGCEEIDFLFMATPIYTNKLSDGFFQGMARFQSDILPLIKLTEYLGLPDREHGNDEPKNHYLTALIKTDNGPIGLTLDEMLARTSLSLNNIKTTSLLPPPFDRLFHRQLAWEGKKVPIIEIQPIVQDSMLRGLTAMAKRLTKAHTDKANTKQAKQGSHAEKVLSAIAFDRICLRMEEVSTVLNLNDPTSVEIDYQRKEIRLHGDNEWLPIHDLGEISFGQPLGLHRLSFGIVMIVDNHKQVFGVEQLDRIDTIQWTANVPRVGANPALGAGSHIELVQIVDRGLQRRLSAAELQQMLKQRPIALG